MKKRAYSFARLNLEQNVPRTDWDYKSQPRERFLFFVASSITLKKTNHSSSSAFLGDLGGFAVNLFRMSRRCEAASPYRCEEAR